HTGKTVRHRPEPAARAAFLRHEAGGRAAERARPAGAARDPRRADEYTRPDDARRTPRSTSGGARSRASGPLLVARPCRSRAGVRPRGHPAARPARPLADDGGPARRAAGTRPVRKTASRVATVRGRNWT